MDAVSIILTLSVLSGFLVSFSMGANDVANAMAPAVSSRAISMRRAVIFAALLNSIGAVFLGAEVVGTVATGIIDSTKVADYRQLMLGMLAALFSSGMWVLIATATGLPVSSTHSVIGAIIGMGLVIGGPAAVKWGVLGGIVAAWLLSPVIGALLAYVVFAHIRATILYSRAMLASARRWAPFWAGLTAALVGLSLMYKTPWGKNFHFSWLHGVLAASLIIAAFIIFGKALWPLLFGERKSMKTARQEGEETKAGGDGNKEQSLGKQARQVENLFRRMQTGTACYVALSHGANDAANAIGPVAAIYLLARQHQLLNSVDMPLWLLLMGGAGIGLGTLLMGRRVMETMGENLTKINNSRGFSISFGAATTVLLASNLGLPISTTHASVGAVVGVGLARGLAAVDFRILGKIVLYWVLTLPIAAISCIIIYYMLARIFGSFSL